MNAREVKDRLYARHRATLFENGQTSVGPWTVLEEFRAIDLLAVAAWSSPPPAPRGSGRYPRVGYEVKVSRGDYRSELLRPFKRRQNVEWCSAFYLAVPFGLLKPEEIAWEEPAEFADPWAFERTPCPARCYRGTLYVWDAEDPAEREVPCLECGGKGFAAPALVEKLAPYLWVPRDVGLVVVERRGCRVLREAPARVEVPALTPLEAGQIIRHVSVRPDPRHATITYGNALAREAAASLAALTEDLPGEPSGGLIQQPTRREMGVDAPDLGDPIGAE